KRGIIAVPRVLWGREDQVLQKVRELKKLVEEARVKSEIVSEVASKALELSREVSELVFRENKILFPAVWVLLTEGEWAAIGEISEEMGYLVPVTKEWKPSARPVMPYEIVPEVTKEQVDALPPEFRELALKKLEADTYDVRVGSDIELSTGFLSKKELEGILKSLPLELTYADMNDRVKFFTESKLSRGFVRTKTILGRRLLYCHPPRLEGMVRVNVERLKKGEEYREYWTKQGDRIIRVLVVAVRSESGEYLGTLEIVEDLTEVVKNPDEVMKKLVVL
ncbi:MAG: PAS domain-containing protein, partial [Zestosphaera sp.]